MQGDFKLRDRAAIEVRGGDHFVAGRQEGHQRDELRRHAAGNGERARGPFERGHALFKNGGGRVADARVDIAVLLQFEKLRGLISVVENIGGCLVNGHRARARV